MKLSIRHIVFLLAMIIAPMCKSQKFFVSLTGQITEYFSGDPIKGVNVGLLCIDEGDTTHSLLMTRKDGFYGFKLDPGKQYLATFVKYPYISKSVVVDTRNIPYYPDVPFYDMDVQITMFEWIPKFDFSFFDGPIGEATYKQSIRNLSWKNEFTDDRVAQMDSIMDEYIKTSRGYYERTIVKRDVKPSTVREAIDSTVEVAVEPLTAEKIVSEFKDTLSSYYPKDTTVAPASQVEMMKGLFFTVQVGVYSKPTKLDELYNITPLNSELTETGKIRYTTGVYLNIAEANIRRAETIKLGVTDAFIVAYLNGKRIPADDAAYLLKKFGPDILYKVK